MQCFSAELLQPGCCCKEIFVSHFFLARLFGDEVIGTLYFILRTIHYYLLIVCFDEKMAIGYNYSEKKTK